MSTSVVMGAYGASMWQVMEGSFEEEQQQCSGQVLVHGASAGFYSQTLAAG